MSITINDYVSLIFSDIIISKLFKKQSNFRLFVYIIFFKETLYSLYYRVIFGVSSQINFSLLYFRNMFCSVNDRKQRCQSLNSLIKLSYLLGNFGE